VPVHIREVDDRDRPSFSFKAYGGPRPFVSDIAVRIGKTIVRQQANLVRQIWRYEMDARITA
jgi:hypothetical protein